MNIFTNIPDTAKHVLFFGYLKNCMGSFKTDLSFNIENIIAIKKHCIDNDGKLDIIVLSDEDFNYICNKSDGMIMQVANFFGNQKEKLKKLYYNIKVWKYTKAFDADNIINYIKTNCLKNNMGYDYIIQNPPYSGSLHLEFLKKGLELLKKDSGKMTIIEPATWLINIKKKNEFDQIKDILRGHVSRVIIENMNQEFSTNQHVPLSITNIDFSKEFDSIEFKLFGEKKMVKDLYQCNMIGDYDTIWSILSKCMMYDGGNMMKKHIYNGEHVSSNNYFLKVVKTLAGINGPTCSTFDFGRHPRKLSNEEINGFINNDKCFTMIHGKFYSNLYISPLYHKYKNYISDKPLKAYDKGKHLTENDALQLTDTKEHLENWMYYVFNNKLPLFLTMCLTIHQQNVMFNYLPWLVDKQYTDEEINELFDFSPEEIALIDKTIKKFERNSPWFKRYMCGKDSVSDEEVQKFIDSL